MRNSFKVNALLVAAVLFIGSTSPAFCWTSIYDNSVNDLETRFDPGIFEVGDQIVLEPSTPRNLIYFDFEYWGIGNTVGSFLGTVEARVRFYENDGALYNGYATPGTKFFDSGWFSGLQTTDSYPYRQTIVFTEGIDFAIGGLNIPAEEITWSVQFRGMDGADKLGVDLYSQPVVGQNYDDYWQNYGSEGSPNWVLLTNSLPISFGARMYVPEPSTSVLALLAGLGIFGVNRLRRKN